MSRSVPILTGLLLAWTVALGANAADDVGLGVGDPAPLFTLVDQGGSERSLGSLLGRGKLAVVFFRSADW